MKLILIEKFKLYSNNIYSKYLLLALGAYLSLFAFAPYNHSIFIVISLLIFLWIINSLPTNLSKAAIFSYCFVYGYCYFNTQIYWLFYSMYEVINAGLALSIFAIICFSAFLGLYIALAGASYLYMKTKSSALNLIILFPSVWVLFEWIRGFLFGGYSWSDIGYTQIDNSSLNGFFPIIGEYGVSWICVSLIGALYLILARLINNKISRQSKAHYRTYYLYVALILISGSFLYRITYTKAYGNKFSVALIQGNIPVDTKWADNDNLRIYAQEIKNAKADLIMLPETAISQFAQNLPTGYLNNIESLARANKADLVVGMPIIINKNNDYVNAATILTLPKHPYYAKTHLVPFGEYIPLQWLIKPLYKFIDLPMVRFSPGNSNQIPLVAANQKIAFNICFENGFGGELINSASQATLMANLSDMVWYGRTVAMYQHLQISQARALENQRYFIQVTNNGLTAIIDPYGHVQAILPAFTRGILKSYIEGRIGNTIFSIVGNLPIICLCLLVVGYCLLLKLVRSASTKKAT